MLVAQGDNLYFLLELGVVAAARWQGKGRSEFGYSVEPS